MPTSVDEFIEYDDFLKEFNVEMNTLETKAEEVGKLTEIIKDYKIKIEKHERQAPKEPPRTASQPTSDRRGPSLK